MIKKDITFYNYAEPTPEQVTKTFYFNYTKIEGLEIELEYGDLEDTVRKLNETEDGKTAYKIFKEILIGAVGVKDNDNEFNKSEAAKRAFVNSPALSVLVWEFVENPELAAPFLEAMLPPQDVAEGKARIERQKLEETLAAQKKGPQDRQPAQLSTAAPVLDTEDVVKIERTDDEILNAEITDLSNEELERLIVLRRAQQ